MANVSPGVYTKIIDLSAFVQAAPSTIGFICALTEKGEDNKLKFIGSRSELISEFGEPAIHVYGKNYGQGLYNAYNFLGESGALYFLRCLPDNAAYSNMRINAVIGASDSTASVVVTYVDGLNSKAEIKTNLTTVTTNYPLCILYPLGRGQWYNKLAVRITEVANPTLWDVYVLDVYEKQSDGSEVIIESFEISFDPLARDSAGGSLWISDVLATYSAVLRAEMQLVSGSFSGGYDQLMKIYDKEIGTVSAVLTSSAATITDNKQNFADWDTTPETGNSGYVVIAKDARGVEIWGWLGASGGADGDQINVFNDRALGSAVQSWNGNVSDFDETGDITYRIKKCYGSVASAFTSSEPVPMKKGSDGDLLDATGTIDQSEGTTLLANGYTGLIDGDILDTENVYFTLVFDCGYPTDVKSSISTLCQTRRDCVGILDNGDNVSVNAALSTRTNIHTFNTYYIALYESFNKVFDNFTGQDIWVSPIYHMSYILPRNDTVSEVWFAPAGYNRAAIDTIKELRFNPRLGQRDQMYLKQLNPIVKFNPGYVVWGQLTSQAKASALQDLNIVRLVLYVKRAFEQFCQFFIFEQNDPITWSQVSSQLIEFLEIIRKRRGLYNYQVDVGATEYEKKTKKFHVNITLQPTRVVEQIELNFFIQ
jgi:hypothetical protein